MSEPTWGPTIKYLFQDLVGDDSDQGLEVEIGVAQGQQVTENALSIVRSKVEGEGLEKITLRLVDIGQYLVFECLLRQPLLYDPWVGFDVVQDYPVEHALVRRFE